MKLLVAILINFAAALYFEINERDKKCFIEELPDDTQMIGKYLVQVFDKNEKVCFWNLTLRLYFRLRRGKNQRQALACMWRCMIQVTNKWCRVRMAQRDG